MLRPSTEVNEVVGAVLARAVQQSAGTVRLHAFTFASNHFHLLARGGGRRRGGRGGRFAEPSPPSPVTSLEFFDTLPGHHPGSNDARDR
ncbi:hypothetical protein D187_001466 [Cystobacter fuscus DSM 2262]|uniref:Transposase IS200-like domain-containing protein n=1 Tax=Cystobacter fuscus (strain ATCC 25194 / DSM 2262 / NBRC 100088 / M29) TaxID=1242864 RepID=S9PEM4_CYSF2|nr:hypothetical protein D187_001466 [Cystobacter fuscus DSM 2262]